MCTRDLILKGTRLPPLPRPTAECCPTEHSGRDVCPCGPRKSSPTSLPLGYLVLSAGAHLQLDLDATCSRRQSSHQPGFLISRNMWQAHQLPHLSSIFRWGKISLNLIGAYIFLFVQQLTHLCSTFPSLSFIILPCLPMYPLVKWPHKHPYKL